MTTITLEVDTELGQISGNVVFCGPEYDCNVWAENGLRTRYVIVENEIHHLGGEFLVVDINKSPFYWMKHSEHNANVETEPDGRVVLSRTVRAYEELFWTYSKRRIEACRVCFRHMTTKSNASHLRSYASICPKHVCDQCYHLATHN